MVRAHLPSCIILYSRSDESLVFAEAAMDGLSCGRCGSGALVATSDYACCRCGDTPPSSELSRLLQVSGCGQLVYMCLCP